MAARQPNESFSDYLQRVVNELWKGGADAQKRVTEDFQNELQKISSDNAKRWQEMMKRAQFQALGMSVEDYCKDATSRAGYDILPGALGLPSGLNSWSEADWKKHEEEMVTWYKNFRTNRENRIMNEQVTEDINDFFEGIFGTAQGLFGGASWFFKNWQIIAVGVGAVWIYGQLK